MVVPRVGLGRAFIELPRSLPGRLLMARKDKADIVLGEDSLEAL